MKIDFKTVEALASPTRVSILRSLLDAEHTPTTLSDELGKAKSTITSHATTLNDADLLIKDEEDGRKRVVYKPTKKAEAIAHGKTKHVTFALTTTAVFGCVSAALYATSATTTPQAETLTATTQQAQPPSNTVFLVAATVLLIVALVSLWYGYMLRRLRAKHQE